jgi:hypothetical protein
MVYLVQVFFQCHFFLRGKDEEIHKFMVIADDKLIAFALGNMPIDRGRDGRRDMGMEVRQFTKKPAMRAGS